MAQFCLIPSLAETFKDKARKGEITPEKLTDMTSEERRTFFSEFLGEENAKKVNAAFEKKLLLKNQQEGIVNWAKQVTGLKPEIQRDILSKVNRMTEILQPEDMNTFLEDLASQRLGIAVTAEEGSRIVDLAKITSEAKKQFDPKTNKWSSKKAQREYGDASVLFSRYINELKNDQTTLLQALGKPKELLKEVAGSTKAIQSSFDQSGIFRPGIFTAINEPKIWAVNAARSFKDVWDEFHGKDVMFALKSDAASRENMMNGFYKKIGLAIVKPEEDFPDSRMVAFVKKIPVVGKAYEASEASYNAFQYRNRMNIADKYKEILDKTDGELEHPEAFGNFINALTGRGRLPKQLEGAADVVNWTFYSARRIAANFDILTGGARDFMKSDSFTRRLWVKTTLKTVMGLAAISALFGVATGQKIEYDPRSPDFMKGEIFGRKIDLTFGLGGLAVLAAQVVTRSYKDKSGNIVDLNTGKYGDKTVGDVLGSFFSNKLSPTAGLVRDIWLKGQDFSGETPTVQSELFHLFTPFGAQSAVDIIQDKKSAPYIAQIMAMEFFGLQTSGISGAHVATLDETNDSEAPIVEEIRRLADKSFRPSVTDFDHPSGNVEKLEKMLDPQQYAEAKQYFVTNYTEEATKLINSAIYKSATLDEKKARLSGLNDKWREGTLKKYGFKHTKEPLTPDT